MTGAPDNPFFILMGIIRRILLGKSPAAKAPPPVPPIRRPPPTPSRWPWIVFGALGLLAIDSLVPYIAQPEGPRPAASTAPRPTLVPPPLPATEQNHFGPTSPTGAPGRENLTSVSSPKNFAGDGASAQPAFGVAAPGGHPIPAASREQTPEGTSAATLPEFDLFRARSLLVDCVVEIEFERCVALEVVQARRSPLFLTFYDNVDGVTRWTETAIRDFNDGSGRHPAAEPARSLRICVFTNHEWRETSIEAVNALPIEFAYQIRTWRSGRDECEFRPLPGSPTFKLRGQRSGAVLWAVPSAEDVDTVYKGVVAALRAGQVKSSSLQVKLRYAPDSKDGFHTVVAGISERTSHEQDDYPE